MRKGFTIIEMLVVIVIIGLMVGMSIPYLNSRRWSLYTYDENVVSSLRIARQLAMTKEMHYGVYSDSTSLVIFYDANEDDAFDTTNDEIFQTIDLPKGLSIFAEDGDGNDINSTNPVIFNAKGMSNVSATFTLTDGKSNVDIYVGVSGFIQ